MNRLYGLIAALFAGLVLFLLLASSGYVKADSKKKMLRLALDREPPTLDPISVTDTTSDGVANKVYNKLVRLKYNAKSETNKWEIVPDLAESYSISDDGKIYTFKMRKGVRFHDDPVFKETGGKGREVKASDAVYSLKRLLSPRSKRAELLKPMVKGSEEYYTVNTPQMPMHDDPNLGIKATDEYTLQIELDTPFAPFIQHLSTISCAVVPKEAAESTEILFSRHPVGTNSFKFVEWLSYQQIVFERNEDYFGGKPKLDAIRFKIVKDKKLQFEQFMAGHLDASVIPLGKVRDAEARAGNENILTSMTMRTNYVGFGCPNGDFKNKADLRPFGTRENKKLRQAMSYALDRENLAYKVLENKGTPALGILPPDMPGFWPGRKGWKQDLPKAKALLAEAGFPDGKGLPPVNFLHPFDEDSKKIAQSIAYDFKQIGVEVTLQALEWKAFLKKVDNEPQPMYMLGWVADYPDPDNFLYVLFNSAQWGEAGNATWFQNDRVDELSRKAREAVKMEERQKIYKEVEDIILDEAPWIPTVHMVNKVLLRKNVKGIREQITPLDTGIEFPQVDFLHVDLETAE